MKNRPHAPHAHPTDKWNGAPPTRGGRPGPHIEGVGTSNLPSTRTIVVSPVPHVGGAGFDGGAAARDQ